MADEHLRKAFFSVLDTFRIQRPIPEYRFHPIRQWRFDFAWPQKKIALEIEGGIFIGGRHSRGAGMQKDMEKYNQAALHGWRIIRVQPNNLCKSTTIQLINSILS